MFAVEDRRDILEKLEADLETFDRVLLVAEGFGEIFITSSMKKILVLTANSLHMADIPKITYRQITAK